MWLAIPFFATFLGILASLSYQFSLSVFPISTTFDTRAEWLAWALLFGSTRVYLRYRKARIGVFESDAARPSYCVDRHSPSITAQDRCVMDISS
jgi:hypothetical protein